MSDGNGWRYTIDDSLYGQFSSICFDKKTPLWIRIPQTDSDKHPRKSSKGILFGRTCDSLDMIAKSYSMEELDVGDWLWFPEMGAYSAVTASEFNGFPKPPVHDVAHALPSLYDLTPNNLKERMPLDVVTVNGVSLGYPTIPGVA
jgi:diaminopimelate decarboxylase